MDENTRLRLNTNYGLANTVQRVHLPKIVIVVATKNAVDVLEERLQRGVTLFDETTNFWVMVTPIYL